MPPFPHAVYSPHPQGGHLILMPDYSRGEGRPGFFAWVRLQGDSLIIHIGPAPVHQRMRLRGISDLTLGHMVARFVASAGIFGPREYRENMTLRCGSGAIPPSPEWIRLRDFAGGVDVVAHMKTPYFVAPASPSGGKGIAWLDDLFRPEDMPRLIKCLESKPTFTD